MSSSITGRIRGEIHYLLLELEAFKLFSNSDWIQWSTVEACLLSCENPLPLLFLDSAPPPHLSPEEV